MHPSQNLLLFVHYRPKITEGLLGINEVPVGKKVSKNLRELPELFFISALLFLLPTYDVGGEYCDSS